MTSKGSVKALQSVLKGEHMSIDVYTAVIDAVPDPTVKARLVKGRDQHKRHAQELAQRIAELGGDPVEGPGVGAWEARAGIRLRGWFETDPRGVLRQVYNGEDQSIATAAYLADQQLDLESKELVERIIAEDRGHLSCLEEVITEKSH